MGKVVEVLSHGEEGGGDRLVLQASIMETRVGHDRSIKTWITGNERAEESWAFHRMPEQGLISSGAYHPFSLLSD